MIWQSQSKLRPLAGAAYFGIAILSTSALAADTPPPPTPVVDTGGTPSQLIGGGDSGRRRREYTVGTRTLYPPPRERKANDAPRIVVSGQLRYALAFSLTGSARATTSQATGQIAFAPIIFTLTGSASVDERPAIEEEAFWLGYLLRDD